MSAPIPTTAAVWRRRRPARLLALSLLLGSVAAFVASPGPAGASTPTSTVTPIGPTGSGTSGDPFVYEIDFDCAELVAGLDDRATLIESPDINDYYEITVNLKGATLTDPTCGFATAGTSTPVTEKSGFDAAQRSTFQYTGTSIGVGAVLLDVVDPSNNPPAGWARWYVGTAPAAPAAPSTPSSTQPAVDPTAATVAVVAEQVAAAGIAGSSSGVRVRGSEVVPSSTTRWLTVNQSALNAIRTIGGVSVVGGASIVSDGLEVRVGSAVGSRSDAGVVVPSGGMLGASVTGALAPGSVVEVWINSQPRLVAAARVPEDGDTVTVAIPTGAPLDGGEAIEDGAHTLELRMYTEDGFEIVATGITVARVMPTGVPAGEGPAPFERPLLLAAGLLAAVVVGRRMVVAG